MTVVTPTPTPTLDVTAHPGAGVEVRGLDVRTADDTTFAALQALFDHHGLVFLRDQQLSEQDHIALAERLGPHRHRGDGRQRHPRSKPRRADLAAPRRGIG